MLITMAQFPVSYFFHIPIPSATFSSSLFPIPCLVHWSILAHQSPYRSVVSADIAKIAMSKCAIPDWHALAKYLPHLSSLLMPPLPLLPFSPPSIFLSSLLPDLHPPTFTLPSRSSFPHSLLPDLHRHPPPSLPPSPTCLFMPSTLCTASLELGCTITW